MPRLEPTVHFEEQWVDRVCPRLPTVDELGDLISHSVRVQRQLDLFTPRGRRYRVLAAYWHPDRGLVFKVDHKRNKIVSVLSERILEGAWPMQLAQMTA